MKKNDIMVLVVVGVIAAIFSAVLSNVLFSASGDKQLSAQQVNPISSEFQKPDPRYFNSEALNPTQLIQIGDNTNPQPF